MDAKFYKSVKDELIYNILPYWEKYACDDRKKGFYGSIDNDNRPDYECERSIVMTSRFLWTYSAAARLFKKPEYLKMADFAYDVIVNKFLDKKFGGVYWSVMPDGTPKVAKKQIYGQAFCCYGLSEYAAAIKELREEGKAFPSPQPASQSSATPSNEEDLVTLPSERAMNLALDLYYLMEEFAYEPKFGGYVEARAKNWKKTRDMILSPKDMNCPKSMNTNLHVMEAYTNLYRNLPVVFGDSKSVRLEVGKSLSDLARTTVEKILQPGYHLGMFFNLKWKLLSDEISFGHDIEASWLLWEAATELNDSELQTEIKDTVIKMAEVTYEQGFDKENGCLENFLCDGGKIRDRTRVWWNQAESMKGFYNAWDLTQDQKYEKILQAQWDWILKHQRDLKGGDWWSALDQNGQPVLKEAKGGNWKTSYHNGRTCMEILKRSKTF